MHGQQNIKKETYHPYCRCHNNNNNNNNKQYIQTEKLQQMGQI